MNPTITVWHFWCAVFLIVCDAGGCCSSYKIFSYALSWRIWLLCMIDWTLISWVNMLLFVSSVSSSITCYLILNNLQMNQLCVWYYWSQYSASRFKSVDHVIKFLPLRYACECFVDYGSCVNFCLNMFVICIT